MTVRINDTAALRHSRGNGMTDHSRCNRPLTEQAFRTNLAAAMAKHAANRPTATSRLELVGESAAEEEIATPQVARAWQQGDPLPGDVNCVRDIGDRRWCLNRTDYVWFLRDIAGPTYSWVELLAIAGPLTEVLPAPENPEADR